MQELTHGRNPLQLTVHLGIQHLLRLLQSGIGYAIAQRLVSGNATCFQHRCCVAAAIIQDLWLVAFRIRQLLQIETSPKRARPAFVFFALAFLPLLFLLLRGLWTRFTTPTQARSCQHAPAAPLRLKKILLHAFLMLTEATRP